MFDAKNFMTLKFLAIKSIFDLIRFWSSINSKKCCNTRIRIFQHLLIFNNIASFKYHLVSSYHLTFFFTIHFAPCLFFPIFYTVCAVFILRVIKFLDMRKNSNTIISEHLCREAFDIEKNINLLKLCRLFSLLLFFIKCEVRWIEDKNENDLSYFFGVAFNVCLLLFQ